MFYDNKYTHWYYNIIEKAKSQPRSKLPKSDPAYIYYESHHIIPNSFGGIEQVLLTGREHFICHLLLVKMCVSEKHRYQMTNALFKMKLKNPHQEGRYYNARLYEALKSKIVIPDEVKAKHRNRVTALNTKTGEHVRVTSEEFKASSHLVGVNTGKRGQKRSEEFKAKRRGEGNAFFGRSHTEETKRIAGAKISIKGKGRPKSEACKAAMRAAWARRKASL